MPLKLPSFRARRDVYRPGRFVQKVKVVTRRDFNIEELSHKDIFGEGPGTVGV